MSLRCRFRRHDWLMRDTDPPVSGYSYVECRRCGLAQIWGAVGFDRRGGFTVEVLTPRGEADASS